eukprot:TRINITY_DN16737_c0_g1_i1.p1 TRINITY_DN16737_c0_g1~~TRINITY_DN16737_c0_g1_i1.p1  ORF type:complete len:464 (+),score=102.77 TRINITY_DN16737_c0_g1_i1:231-1622(+)
MTSASIDITSPGQDVLKIALFRPSLFKGFRIEEDGGLLDSSDPMQLKVVAKLEALIPFAGKKIDKFGNIRERDNTIVGKTTDYEELGDDPGFKVVCIGECRTKVAEHWGWPAERVVLRRPNGEVCLDDSLELTGSTILQAHLAPRRVPTVLLLPGAQRLGESAAEATAATVPADDASVRIVAQTSLASGATLKAFKRRLVHKVGLPMDSFVAYAYEESEASIAGYADRRNGCKVLKDEDDLEELGVPAVLFVLRAEIARLLVEIRNADALWLAAKTGTKVGTPLLREVNVQIAQELFNTPVHTSDGEVQMRLEDPGSPFRWHVGMRGIQGTAYEGQRIWADVELPSEWPRKCPTARFTTPLYHCNVHLDGAIQAGALGAAEERWAATSTIFLYLVALVERLCLPDPLLPNPARPELARQLRQDPVAYDFARREHMRNANARPMKPEKPKPSPERLAGSLGFCE